MYLGIDCETTGLSRAQLAPEDPSQPHATIAARA